MVDELLYFRVALDASIHNTCNLGAIRYLSVSELTQLPVACLQQWLWIARRFSGRPTEDYSSQLTYSPAERNEDQPFLWGWLNSPDSPGHWLNLKGCLNIFYNNGRRGGTRWQNRLRHCATRWNVAGWIPDDFIGMFHWHNPSGRTMALESTQPLTEVSRIFPGG